MRKYAGLWLFLALLTLYLVAPVSQITDSRYSMLVSQALIEYRTPSLGKYKIAEGENASGAIEYPGQIEVQRGKPYYYFPIGSSVLSIPFVALMQIWDISPADAEGTYLPEQERAIQQILAAALMAGAGVLFFLMARMLLPLHVALLAALALSLGTTVFSTASRALWSHTWLVFLLSLALYLLWKAIETRKQPQPELLATIVSWLYFIRPTAGISIIAISVLVFVFFHRSVFIRYSLTGLGWLGAFVFYSLHIYGTWLPTYYSGSRIGSDTFVEALLGTLFSPARGLFVYSPFFAVVFLYIFVSRKQLRRRALVITAILAVALHWGVTSAFPHWWGGHSYGPRFMTDILPWLAMLTIIACRVRLDFTCLNSGNYKRSSLLMYPLTLLVFISVFIHFEGAFNTQTVLWNVSPRNIDFNPERVWDWRNPQFLAGFQESILYQPQAFLPAGERLMFNTEAAAPFLTSGWSAAEPEFRWTSARNAGMGFHAPPDIPLTMDLLLAPFVTPKHPRQRLNINVNGEPVASFELDKPEGVRLSFTIPADLLETTNILSLNLPDAISPRSLGLNTDTRRLGVAVKMLTSSVR